MGVLRCDLSHAPGARRRRDAARPVGQTGRRVHDARRRAARAHRERESGRSVRDLGGVSRSGAARAHHVWADDGGVVDLHRHAGDSPGDIRDLCRRRSAALSRIAARPNRTHGWTRRHGWGPAARRDHERGNLSRGRGGPRPRATPAGDPLSRPIDDVARRGARVVRGRAATRRTALGGARRQLRGDTPGAGPPRVYPGCRNRSDIGP